MMSRDGLRWAAPVMIMIIVLSACQSSDDATDASRTGQLASTDETRQPPTVTVDRSTPPNTSQPSTTALSATAPNTVLVTTTVLAADLTPNTVLAATPVPATTQVQPSISEQSIPTTTAGPPEYLAVITEIGPVLAARMSASWRPGCPVTLEQLRHVEITHWNFEGKAVTGELVVNADAALQIADAFGALFESGYRIERMELVDVYDADDDLSMAANNTSAFNCREVAWRPGVWSVHALGLAIDINPLVNPYVSATRLLPPEGAPFADRTLDGPGLIHAGDPVVEAFANIGWTWGGYWSSAKDYQHFSATGR